jgi:predicted DNA-binding transcriptional regulator YafY
LQELGELGIPLYSEIGRYGGYQVLRERILPPISFSEQEALAMFFAYQSIQQYSSLPFESESISALKKFYHYLPSDVKQQIDNMKDRVIFWVLRRESTSPYLKLLLEASIDQKCLTIEYESSNGISKREIQPIGLYAESGFWYCPSYCFMSEEFRLFRADRIQKAVLCEGCVPIDLSKMSIQDWLGVDCSAN